MSSSQRDDRDVWTYQPAPANTDRLYVICFVGIGGALALGLLGIVQATVEARGGDQWAWPYVVACVALWAIALGPLGYLIGLIVRGFRRGGSPADAVEGWIAANGFDRIASSATPEYPGALFRADFPNWAFARLVRHEPRFLEIGSIGQRVPAGETVTADTWGYVAMRLPKRLPHILLEAASMGQNTSGALPVSVDPEQRVSLEGDFDRHFTLSAPKGSEVDALSILAPDVMALLIDEVGGWSVEIVGDWLFIYAADDWVHGASVATYDRILRVADLIAAKADRRAHAFRDDPVEPAGPVDRSRPAVEFADAGAVAARTGRGRDAALAPGRSQYSRLFRRSMVVLVAMCVAFVVLAFVLIGLVRLAYP